MRELPHLDDLPFSDRLLRFHRGRLAELDPTAHEVLSLLGPLGEAPLETLSYAADADPETVRRVLSELEEARFVVSSSDGYRLAHPDYAELGSKWSPSPSPPGPAAWLGPASGIGGGATKSTLRPLIRSPGLDRADFDAPLPPPGRSLFPHGWRPQPPAYIAAVLLIGIIWIVWTVVTRG